MVIFNSIQYYTNLDQEKEYVAIDKNDSINIRFTVWVEPFFLVNVIRALNCPQIYDSYTSEYQVKDMKLK
jgi:hypothetical protein